MTQNAINTSIPIEVADGGTGNTATTENALVIGGSGVLTETGLMTDGQLVIGSSTNAPATASLASADASVTITPGAGTIDLAATSSGMTYSSLTSDTKTAVVNEGYVVNNSSWSVVVTMPNTATIGDKVNIIGESSGKYQIKADSTNSIIYLGDTATGSDYFEVTNQNACVKMVVSETDSVWTVTNVEDLTPGLVYNAVDVFGTASGIATAYFLLSGALYSVGSNNLGQLGDQTTDNKSSPVQVAGNHEFIQITAATNTGYGLKADGSAWSWGSNSAGALGNNINGDKSSPVLVVGTHSFVEIAAASTANGYGLKADGSAWGWGSNGFGQLGDQTTDNKSSPVTTVGSHSFIQICGSGSTQHGLKADGSTWSWGYNLYGGIGDQTVTSKSSPVAVVGAHSFIQLVGVADNVYGLKADGSVWSWGRGLLGALGDQTTTDKSSPVLVVGAHSFINIFGKYSGCLGLKESAEIWGWGHNNYGQLGDNTTADKSSPVQVVGGIPFKVFTQQTTGSTTRYSTDRITPIFDDSGNIWTWGYNTTGELGDQTTTNKSSPVLVVGITL